MKASSFINVRSVDLSGFTVLGLSMRQFVDFVKNTLGKKSGLNSFLLLDVAAAVCLIALLLWPSSYLKNTNSANNSSSRSQEQAELREGQSNLKKFCDRLKTEFKRYKWQQNPCGKSPWLTYGTSPGGYPLTFLEIGADGPVTLILSGVHPDEINPVPIAYALADHLKGDGDPLLHDRRVVIAPLVNPDGFLKEIPTRTNGIGVDLNRNFPTVDWPTKAVSRWKKKGKDPRRFPGKSPASEIETEFMMHLIDTYKPDKIVSIHAPLGFLDYDGPGDRKPHGLSEKERKAKDLAKVISLQVGDYKVVDYAFFPGSLGNYAGNERGIPTVTVELKSADPTKFDFYWEKFRPGLIASIKHNAKRLSH